MQRASHTKLSPYHYKETVMNKSPFRILKLRSGEDIVAKMVNNKKDSIVIERPMLMKVMHYVEPMTGSKRESIILYDWLKATDQNRITIPKDHILLISGVNPDVHRAYEMQKKYDDTPTNIPSQQQKPPSIQKELEGFNIQNMLDSIHEQLKAARIKPEDLENLDIEEILEEMDDDEQITIIEDDRTSSEDYGTAYSDWSPDPEDYLT